MCAGFICHYSYGASKYEGGAHLPASCRSGSGLDVHRSDTLSDELCVRRWGRGEGGGGR